jgi:hypothetical protein
LTRTVLELRWAASGFNPDGVIQMRATFPPAPDGTRVRQPFRDIVDALRGAPGVAAAAHAGWALGPDGYSRITLSDTTRVRTTVNVVSEDYFEALQIVLLAGRTLTASDVLATDGRGRDDVVVVSAVVADRLARQGPAVGQRVQLRDRVSLVNGRPTQVSVEVEVIGVVGDARLGDPRGEETPTIYRPGLTPGWPATLLIAAGGLSVAGGFAAWPPVRRLSQTDLGRPRHGG